MGLTLYNALIVKNDILRIFSEQVDERILNIISYGREHEILVLIIYAQKPSSNAYAEVIRGARGLK